MKTIGILGGMGPMATVDLLQKIIRYTDARSDNEHIHVITDCNCEIPDRTAFIRGEGESPLKYMADSARKLKEMGADFLIMPCNTAHYFYDELKREAGIPFLSMIRETAESVGRGQSAGLMATLGTYEGEVYQKVFRECGSRVIVPDEEARERINNMIYDYKRGIEVSENSREEVIGYFRKQGVDRVILGCTELPLIFQGYRGEITLIDPTEILSKSAIVYAGRRVAESH